MGGGGGGGGREAETVLRSSICGLTDRVNACTPKVLLSPVKNFLGKTFGGGSWSVCRRNVNSLRINVEWCAGEHYNC